MSRERKTEMKTRTGHEREGQTETETQRWGREKAGIGRCGAENCSRREEKLREKKQKEV